MGNQEIIEEAATNLWRAVEQRSACAPIRELIGVDNLSLAYAVQKVNIDRRLAAGEQTVGVKVGLTSKVVQEQLGVDQPDFGVLTDRMEVKLGDEVPWNELFQPKAEAEVAFKLAKDLPSEKIDMDTLKDAIEGAAVSIEIVGSRVKDWNIRITDTIADNASASHFVVSDHIVPLAGLDLEGCEMQLHKNGDLVSEGKGSACLGSPLNAALWLVNTWAEIGMPLKEGYWVLAGALGPMVPVEPSDVFEASIDGLGGVKVKFGNEK